MANDKTDDGRQRYVRSPGQAHRLFGFDSDRFDGNGKQDGITTIGTPRPKFLFLARFRRGTGVGNESTWSNGVQFAVKKLDRPVITIETQTLNQYNKKRVIQTGIKYGPVKMEFHDTADQSVMQMWHEYASYYYGDFRKANASDWDYDIVNPDFKNIGNEGFGLTLPSEKGSSSISTQASFFSSIECYQFSGGTYTQFDLVNPKISNFAPDDMDYSSDQGHGLTITLEYETIIYHNDSKPVVMRSNESNSFIKSLLADPYFNGDVIEPYSVSNMSSQNRFPDTSGNRVSSQTGWNTIPNIGQQLFGSSINSANNSIINSISKSITGSALGSFGAFNFGRVSTMANSAMTNVLSSVMNGNRNSTNISATSYDVAQGVSQTIANASPQVAATRFSDAMYDANMTNNALPDFSGSSPVGTLELNTNNNSDSDWGDWA